MGASETNAFRISRLNFDRFVPSGGVAEDERVELIDGAILKMSPVDPSHRAIVQALNRWFSRRLPEDLECQVQDPIAISDASAPQLDIAIVRFREDEYAGGHPAAEDVLLVIEAADTSIEFDRGVKAALYARAGIAEYWVFNVTLRVVYAHRQPSADRYLDIRTVGTAASLTPVAIPSVELPVSVIFR